MSQKQMYCGVAERLVIYLCLLGFTAAKCVPRKCGSLNVSYPFWINNPECGDQNFQIICTKDEDTGTMTPLLPVYVDYTLEKMAYYKIRELDYTGYIVIESSSLKASSCGQSEKADAFKWFRAPGPFYFSNSDKFVVVGCNKTGSYTYLSGTGEASCVSSCGSREDSPYCRYGCCEITVPNNYYSINFTAAAGGNVSNDGTCGFSTIMDPQTFTAADNKTDLSWVQIKNANYGLRLNWGIGGKNCSDAKATGDYSCSFNAECKDSPSGIGHVCKCPPGFEGDGYSNGIGCKDIDECAGKSNECVAKDKGGICHNLGGSYNCSCAKGYMGDGFKNETGCESESSNNTAMFAAIGSVSAFLGVSLGTCGLVWWLRMHYQKHARDENFRCNGGFLLQKILEEKGKQTDGKNFRIFSEQELKRASQSYSNDMKLGSGGSSTVYKGILSNNAHVAIKKFKEFPIGVENKEPMKHFINEIVVLSSLNHKNVVNLVGCCLQTQSPVLVYEFVEGGTVSSQLQSSDLNWQNRLQIAMGSAEALEYLHSDLDHPRIIHRDVKSSNILLDITVTPKVADSSGSSNILLHNTVTPKVADFGISRLLGGNDAYLNTNIMGTCGYMDPEYFGTSTLTEKSDVYSFGVFLAELLTGREPLSPERPQQEVLLSQIFLSKCKDNCLTDILDPKVKNEENEDQMIAVASLARECLLPEGSARPSMREVKMELERIEGCKRDTT